MKYSAIVATTLAAFASANPTTSCKPGTYSCTTDHTGWQVCNTSGQWQFAGTCPPKTVCKFLAANGSPYCVPPDYNL